LGDSFVMGTKLNASDSQSRRDFGLSRISLDAAPMDIDSKQKVKRSDSFTTPKAPERFSGRNQNPLTNSKSMDLSSVKNTNSSEHIQSMVEFGGPYVDSNGKPIKELNELVSYLKKFNSGLIKASECHRDALTAWPNKVLFKFSKLRDDNSSSGFNFVTDGGKQAIHLDPYDTINGKKIIRDINEIKAGFVFEMQNRMTKHLFDVVDYASEDLNVFSDKERKDIENILMRITGNDKRFSHILVEALVKDKVNGDDEYDSAYYALAIEMAEIFTKNRTYLVFQQASSTPELWTKNPYQNSINLHPSINMGAQILSGHASSYKDQYRRYHRNDGNDKKLHTLTTSNTPTRERLFEYLKTKNKSFLTKKKLGYL
jgi:hypothetical protein